MLEQRRSQSGAAGEDKVPAALRLDAPNAFNEIRTNTLEWSPFKTLRTVGRDKFCGRIEPIPHRAARRLGPVFRPEIVGATAKQQVEALAVSGEYCIPASGSPIRRGPVAVRKAVVI